MAFYFPMRLQQILMLIGDCTLAALSPAAIAQSQNYYKDHRIPSNFDILFPQILRVSISSSFSILAAFLQLFFISAPGRVLLYLRDKLRT
jgi:hypothetical protein